MSSIRLEVKLERARHHLDDLHEEVQALHRGARQALRDRVDPATGELVVYLDGLPPIDPRLCAIAGDAIHNMRAALDHLACALVRASGNEPTDQTSFR